MTGCSFVKESSANLSSSEHVRRYDDTGYHFDQLQSANPDCDDLSRGDGLSPGGHIHCCVRLRNTKRFLEMMISVVRRSRFFFYHDRENPSEMPSGFGDYHHPGRAGLSRGRSRLL